MYCFISSDQCEGDILANETHPVLDHLSLLIDLQSAGSVFISFCSLKNDHAEYST